MSKEYTYDIGKYTIGVDTNGEDEIGMTVAKIENGDIYFLGNCYGENARCIDEIIKENEQLKRNCNIGNENLNFYREEYKKLEDNWNKLKEKVNEGMRVYRNRSYDLVFDIEEISKEDLNEFISYLAFQVMEQLIINIEQGSDK